MDREPGGLMKIWVLDPTRRASDSIGLGGAENVHLLLTSAQVLPVVQV